MTTVLVTGGAGYIGSHACKALSRAGVTPVAFDNLVHGHRDAVRWGPLVEGDLLEPWSIRQALDEHRPAAVMHFAAYAYVGESVADPGKYYRNNVAGSLNLIEAMRVAGVGAMVFSSTCATYGLPLRLPMDETHPQQPINPYGASKHMIERMLADFRAAHGLRSTSLRYFNAAGADPDGELGEEHEPETHLIPLVLRAAAGRTRAITVYGADYDTPDGTCVRDYVHVSDLAHAHVLALRALLEGRGEAAYNLGCGRGHSVAEVIETARRVTGKEIPVELAPRRPGDPPRLVADASRIRGDLGWAPRLEKLADIIGSAWRWQQRRPAQEGSPD